MILTIPTGTKRPMKTMLDMLHPFPGSFLALAVLLALGTGACERQAQPSAKPAPPAPAGQSLIDFPSEVHADDPAVNQFIRRVISTCAEGDYERFRLLWAVRETPFPRQEFERGWKALKKVRVAALQKMKHADGEYLYSLHVQVKLDESVPEPARDVVLLIVRENGQWRLARAPAHHRKRVLGITDDENANENSPGGGDVPP